MKTKIIMRKNPLRCKAPECELVKKKRKEAIKKRIGHGLYAMTAMTVTTCLVWVYGMFVGHMSHDILNYLEIGINFSVGTKPVLAFIYASIE
jgi:hypothetical protein